MSDENRPSVSGVAFVWVSRILAVTFEMILPGIVGQWLDGWLGTNFLVLVGFGCGIALAIWHLLLMTAVPKQRGRGRGKVEQGK